MVPYNGQSVSQLLSLPHATSELAQLLFTDSPAAGTDDDVTCQGWELIAGTPDIALGFCELAPFPESYIKQYGEPKTRANRDDVAVALHAAGWTPAAADERLRDERQARIVVAEQLRELAADVAEQLRELAADFRVAATIPQPAGLLARRVPSCCHNAAALLDTLAAQLATVVIHA